MFKSRDPLTASAKWSLFTLALTLSATMPPASQADAPIAQANIEGAASEVDPTALVLGEPTRGKMQYGQAINGLAFQNPIAPQNSQTIRPREPWLDDRGKHIQAHGGGVIKLGDTWYWFGQDFSKDNDPGKRYVACYSSTDLVNWKFRNQVVKMTDPENFGPEWVLERPKVFYNAKTKKFVMYVHVDGSTPNRPSYGLGRVAVAVSDTVDGDYQYIRSFRPLGQESRDIGQFIDDDGSAYLIFESRPTKGFYIAKLSDDYLDVEKETCFIKAPLEGGAIVHFDGLYYMIGSGLTGWAPNANKYATAPRLEGPWSEFQDIAPPETKTYGSQSSMLIKVTGTKTTSVIFMGDMWKPNTQWDSRYLWMPLEIGDGKLRLPAPSPWKLDAKTGEAVITP